LDSKVSVSLQEFEECVVDRSGHFGPNHSLRASLWLEKSTEITNVKLTKKKIVTAAVAVAIGVSGGTAIAFWSTSGSGTGTAGVGTGASSVTVAQNGAISNLYPGGAAQDVGFTITNGSAAPVQVQKVLLAVTGTDKAGCTAADFTVTNAQVDAQVDGNDFAAFTNGATIKMNNLATNQDACKGAIVDLSFTMASN
jgi:hypothetical protein